jgi:protein-S-isoprenylcysteine O-methyltransferase Ste14
MLKPSYLFFFFAFTELVLWRLTRPVPGYQKKDRGSLYILLSVIILSAHLAKLSAQHLPQWGISALLGLNMASIRTLYGVGLLVFASGMALRWFSVFYLGRLYTFEVAIAEDHRVISTGPYRYMRHPAYSFSLLSFFGLGICADNVLSLLLFTVPISWALLHRIRIEEAALTDALGRHYTDYALKTSRLIPYIY